MTRKPKEDLGEAVQISRDSEGLVHVVLLAEVCDLCHERVRYWNDDGREGGTGNASCGCCQEGPEVCDPIALRPQATNLITAAFAHFGRPNKADRARVDRGDFVRASGLAICTVGGCGLELYDHPVVPGYEWLHRRCDGALVKL